MKYYGMMYHGNVASYDFSKAIVRDSAYDALADANEEWNKQNDPEGYHLLVVFRCDDNGDISEKDCNAYFQFVSTKSSEKFIKDHNQIQWSNPKSQKWNGDAKLMG